MRLFKRKEKKRPLTTEDVLEIVRSETKWHTERIEQLDKSVDGWYKTMRSYEDRVNYLEKEIFFLKFPKPKFKVGDEVMRGSKLAFIGKCTRPFKVVLVSQQPERDRYSGFYWSYWINDGGVELLKGVAEDEIYKPEKHE